MMDNGCTVLNNSGIAGGGDGDDEFYELCFGFYMGCELGRAGGAFNS